MTCGKDMTLVAGRLKSHNLEWLKLALASLLNHLRKYTQQYSLLVWLWDCLAQKSETFINFFIQNSWLEATIDIYYFIEKLSRGIRDL